MPRERRQQTSLEAKMSVNLRRQDEFAVITLDRPEALNALSSAVLRELAQAFDQVAGSDARALIITGAGS
jgi:enoyl-CoA hydratase